MRAGVARDAGADEVKRAYRSAALRLHPDKNGGDADAAAAFQRVGFAYSVLSDAKKKRYYDETGAAGQSVSCLRGTARVRALHRAFHTCTCCWPVQQRLLVVPLLSSRLSLHVCAVRAHARNAHRRHGGD